MGVISITAVRTIMDSVASAKLIFDASVGTTGSQANTVALAAANDVATVTAIVDNDVQSDLAWWFRLRAQQVLSPNLYAALGVYNVWVALEKHTGGLDVFLRTNNVRVDPGCKALGVPLSPEQLMPPVLDPMATFSVTGDSVGTFTGVADIDTTLYGRAWLELVVTSSSGISSAPIAATVNGLQLDGVTPTFLTAVIAAGSSQGTSVALGTLGTQTDSYTAVTAISVIGGTAGDAFHVRSVVERAITVTLPVVTPAVVGYELIETMGGDPSGFIAGGAGIYPSGATFESLAPGSWPVVLNSTNLSTGNYYFECSARVATAGAIAQAALFDIVNAPDTPISGTEIIFTADELFGERKRSATFTIPATDTTIGVKVTTNTGIGAAAWGCRILRA